MVSLKIGSVDEDETDPLKNFFFVEFLENLEAMDECFKNMKNIV